MKLSFYLCIFPICDINDKNMGQIMTNKSHVRPFDGLPFCTLNDWTLNIISIWQRQNGFLSNSILLSLHIECPPSAFSEWPQPLYLNHSETYYQTTWMCERETETFKITFAGLLWVALSTVYWKYKILFKSFEHLFWWFFLSLSCTARLLFLSLYFSRWEVVFHYYGNPNTWNCVSWVQCLSTFVYIKFCCSIFLLPCSQFTLAHTLVFSI